jgi:hypothetical protein
MVRKIGAAVLQNSQEARQHSRDVYRHLCCTLNSTSGLTPVGPHRPRGQVEAWVEMSFATDQGR